MLQSLLLIVIYQEAIALSRFAISSKLPRGPPPLGSIWISYQVTRVLYCFYFPARLQDSRSAEELPDNGDMSFSPQKQSGSTDSGITVLAVLPDLSNYHTEPGEAEKQLQRPRNTSKAIRKVNPRRNANRLRLSTSPTERRVSRPRMRRMVVGCFSFGLLLLAIFSWAYVAKILTPSTASPLRDACVTRFATPPDQTAAIRTVAPVHR